MNHYELVPCDHRYNIPFDQITKDSFLGQSLNMISIWFYKNRKNLSYHTVSAMQRVYQTHDLSDTLPQHIREYCPEEELKYAIGTIKSLPKSVRHLIPSVVSFATNYDNVSCHELLFRVKQAPVVSLMPATFLTLLQSASNYERRVIRNKLMEHTEVIHDLAYVIKLRLLELADDKGVELSKLFMPLCCDAQIRQQLNTLFADFSSLWEKPDEAGCKDNLAFLLNDNNILASFLSTVCIHFNISADWLLLHDYSMSAVMPDGSALSDTEREYLSLFLRADFPTQSMIIADLIAAKTRDCILPLT